MKTWLAFINLTKPRLTSLSVLSGITGFVLVGLDPIFTLRFLWTLLGICLLGGGANSLNMLMERDFDSMMDRTKKRPLPSKTLSPQQVLAYGVTISACGLYVLSALVNPLAGWLGLMTLVSYLLVYTPLKRKTIFNTLVGAVPGALPPFIGYAAAAGHLNIDILFFGAILFIWQMPHFFALSWIYREDYRRAGYNMLCVVDDKEGSMTARQTNMFVLYLLPISLAPVYYGYVDSFYLIGALVAGLGFLACSVWLFRGVNDKSARRVFRYSIVYLSAIMFFMIGDKYMNVILESLLGV